MKKILYLRPSCQKCLGLKVVSKRIRKIHEVDQYTFVLPSDVICSGAAPNTSNNCAWYRVDKKHFAVPIKWLYSRNWIKVWIWSIYGDELHYPLVSWYLEWHQQAHLPQEDLRLNYLDALGHKIILLLKVLHHHLNRTSFGHLHHLKMFDGALHHMEWAHHRYTHIFLVSINDYCGVSTISHKVSYTISLDEKIWITFRCIFEE